MRAVVRSTLLRWRLVLFGIVLILAASAAFTTVDSVTVELGLGGRTDCGSPLAPATVEESAVEACQSRLDRTRATRLGSLTVGLALAIALILALLGHLRHPGQLVEPARGLRPVHLTSERLRIRGAVPADLDGILATMDAAMRDANGWGMVDVAAFAAQVADARPEPSTTHVVFADGATERIVGVAQVRRSSRRAAPTVGWWIGPDHRRQGFGTEGVSAVIAALHAQGFPTVSFRTAADNAGVLRIADRIGAIEVERGPHELPNGRARPSITFVHRA